MSEMPRRAVTVGHKYADVICANCSIGNSIADDGAWYCGHCGAILGKPERLIPPVPPDLATLRADYLYRYGDTHPVCALVDRVQAAEAALAAIGKLTDMPGEHPPEKIVEQVKGLRENYNRICGRLQNAVQRHHLGLGGEQIDGLVVEALDLNMADVRAWQRVYPLIVSHGRSLPDERIRAIARDYYAEVEALAARAPLP